MDEELIKNFSSFINETSNRNAKVSSTPEGPLQQEKIKKEWKPVAPTAAPDEAESHSTVRSADESSSNIASSAKPSRRGRSKLKLMNIELKIFDKHNRPGSARLRPNDQVARKLAAHGATANAPGSILATVTFMPHSRARFSSCLAIDRNGSIRSLKGVKANPNRDSK